MPQFGGVLPDRLVSDDLPPARSLFIGELLSPGRDLFLESQLWAGTADVPAG
jgi:hypothetical protein